MLKHDSDILCCEVVNNKLFTFLHIVLSSGAF